VSSATRTASGPCTDAIRCLDNRAGRTDYASARARGLAIGSGAVEATCKSPVAIPMKRAGSRWNAPAGNEVLALRALQLSDRWEAAVSGALKPLAKAVRVAQAPPVAARAEPPPACAEGHPGRRQSNHPDKTSSAAWSDC
jgi:hypothetical protein